jgi:3-dehydroquinate synthase
VFETHGRPLVRALKRAGPLHTALVPDGERYKERRTLDSLYDAFLEARLGRDGLVVAVGGGVVGDLAGFAAASWMRGVDWVVVPTTLLAMVDSAIGGKVAINHARAKNMIGAFHQPRAVVIDPAFLATLPMRELRSGAYEVLKCAVLGDDALFARLRRAPAGLEGWERPEVDNAIATACRIKAEVVEKDEREGKLRFVLNLGHTIGHALEAVTRYKRYTHGEAVGWGLIAESWIARERGLLAASAYEAIADAVDHLGPRPRLSDLRPGPVLEAISHDKKARAGRVPFVLPTAVGRVVVEDDVASAEIRAALAAMAKRER